MRHINHEIRRTGRGIVCSVVVLLMLVVASPAAGQVGHVLSGVGPVDQAMAGAGATALPQDALSALHWNSAAIVRQRSSVSASLQLLFPTGHLASSVDANAFGPGFPQADLAGRTTSEAGPFPIPALGVVFTAPASPWALGLSAFGVGGFGVDYEIEPTNPITTPQPPGGMGFGAIFSEFQLLQIAPTFAYRVSESLAVGMAPTFNLAGLEVNPFPAATPDDANSDGFPSYPDAPRDWAPGYGVQAGVQWSPGSGLHLGASFKSTQQFSDFEFDGEDEAGAARTFAFNLDYPMILSVGAAYDGIDRLTLAADVRYLDFENTDGFGDAVFDERGVVQGFGWNSILAVAVGAQVDLTERLPVRVGYSYNENPIDDDVAFFNIPSPAIVQHRISGGLTYRASDRVAGSLAVQYGFENEIAGTWMHPQFGALPPTSVRSDLATFFVVFGVEVGL